MYGSLSHLISVLVLTPAAFAKADLVIAFMSFVLHFSFKDSIITGSSSDTLLTMTYVDHLIPCRILHLPSVLLLRRPVAGVIVVEGEGLSPRHRVHRVILYREVRILVNELAALKLAGYRFIDCFLPGRIIALPQPLASASPPFELSLRVQ